MSDATTQQGDEDFIITDLETGKKYRINESGDQVELAEGEHVPVDEFLDLFGYLKLPAAESPKESIEGEELRSPYSSEGSKRVMFGNTAIMSLMSRTKRKISESQCPSTVRQTPKYLSSESTIPIMTNKRSEKFLSNVRLVQEMKVHEGVVWVMQFSPDKTLLATGGEDANVYVWNVMENRNRTTSNQVDLPVFEDKPAMTYKGHKSDILDLCWAPGSEFILSASLDKSVRLWHIKHENCLREFPHANYVTSIRFHPSDSGRFVSGSGDGVLRLWDIADCKVVGSASIASEKDIFTALCFSADGRTIVAGCFDGRCRIYNLTGNRLEKRAEIDVKNRAGKHRKGTKVTGIVQTNAGDNTFLVSTHDSRIRLLQATTPPRHLCKFKGHENASGRPIVASSTSNGDFIISGSDDGRVFLWNGATRPFKKQEREKVTEWEAFHAHSGFCPVAIFCPDSCRRPYEKLDIGSASGLNYHALMKMIGLATPNASNLPPEFSFWGQVFITGGSRGEIRVWENFGIPSAHH